MSLKKVIVSGAAALALMGTAALASGPKVEVGCDGTGDYLLAPVYYAVNNWKTELKVVNTNTEKAIVAKVVVRESKESEEIMDFAIYLTPGDVWTGTLYDDNGVIKLKSTDDSMIISGQQASPNNPIEVGVHPRRENVQNGKFHMENWHGYVEIIGLAKYDPRWFFHSGWSKPCDAMNKMVFYNAVKNGNNLNLNINGHQAEDVGNDDLMGKETLYAEASSVDGRRYMSLNMLALENFATVANGTNAIGGDTKVQDITDKGLLAIAEYDQAIAKSNIFVMYEGDGNDVYPIRTHFTVPTKKYWFDAGTLPTAYVSDNLYGESPFVPNTGSEWAYSINPSGNEVVVRDNSEHCNKCKKSSEVSGVPSESCEILIHEEVHFFEYTNTNPANLYDAGNPYRDLMFKSGGWVDFDLTNNSYTNNDYAYTFEGMPIVPTTFYARNVQGTILNNWLYNQYKNAVTMYIVE
ncbi:hypothetical protein [Nitratiruptor tergarcus]|uniref:Uncharacterized protein n=1 Tax=Nitratiruptor tergarcus DSM 16512 TaxID=1069081 RepID=A0A1W1WVV0_9BACT|nr:hypothetical protein [Nitratiruptor tergarcus]SMC10170.1 hypothetical protein SAMN05660197_2012 [Nitratiruptor tergarcus DSM 16512]